MHSLMEEALNIEQSGECHKTEDNTGDHDLPAAGELARLIL